MTLRNAFASVDGCGRSASKPRSNRSSCSIRAMSGLSRVGAHEASQDTWHSQTLNHHPGSAALKSEMACSSPVAGEVRSEEHTSELQSLMRISYAVFCLKKKHR